MKTEVATAAIIGLAAVSGLFGLAGGRGAQRQEEAASPVESRSVWDGVYTKEQARRGEKLYATHCASCHGVSLGGGESAPPLAGGEFLSNWNGLTVGDLFERIRVSMPQDRPGRLGREVNADILSYIISVNKFPAGQTELPHQTEVLKEIRFEAVKPGEQK